MKTYKIKMEDKAALLNRLDAAEVDTDSYKIVDNKLEGYFEFTLMTPEDIEKTKIILRQSPKIDKITEILRRLVREELQSDNLKMDQIYYYKGDKLKYLKFEKGYYYFNTFKNGNIDDVTRLEKKDLVNLSLK
jgi:predicted ATP-binding protein involved in virulence